MALGSNNPFPSVLHTEQSSAPANPAAGKQRVYIRTSDHHLVRVNSSGTVTDIEGGLSFGTVAVSGQSNVVADAAGDTLTLAAGTGVTITTNAGTDTVTITASGTGDVVGPASAVNNQIAVFDSTTGKLIKDGGQTIAQVISAASGSAAAGGSDKEIQYNNTGALGGISPSTAGFVLTSNGTSSTPSFQAASSGAVALITETVTSGTAASVSFTSISSSYRDLIVKVRGRGDTAAALIELRMRFNNDSGSNYNYEEMHGIDTSVASSQSVGATAAYAGHLAAASATASYAGVADILIGDYRGTTFFKSFTVRTFASGGTGGFTQIVDLGGGLWRSASAITRVDIFPSAGNFVDGTVVSLYGSL